jgi:UDP-N-acetylmuramate--alanine ligase
MKRIHFVGIGGSGLSGVAGIAKAQGYEISGCDLNINTPYIDELKSQGVKIFQGQSENHIDNADLVVVSPAVFFQKDLHPEVLFAKKQGKLLTAREFESQYLQKDKKIICIAGTHGKSTTTAMAGLLFEKANLDPTVMIGANVKEWNGNFRTGAGDVYISEADEFYDSFLSYSPDVIILNNIEFDHPDYFKNEEQMFESFARFVKKLKGNKILIYNEDDFGIKKLFKLLGKEFLRSINLHPYSSVGKNIKLHENETQFETNGEIYKLKIPGEFNVNNALGVISLGEIFNISTKMIKNSLENFSGIGRRLELIGERNNIKVYDDYAHHPTAIKKTLKALRQKYPKNKIFAVVEPHTFSRTKALLPLYKNAFIDADNVVITPIYKSRDTEDFGINGENIVKVSEHISIRYVDNFKVIITFIKESVKPSDIVIVMGAGESYKLAREILNIL